MIPQRLLLLLRPRKAIGGPDIDDRAKLPAELVPVAELLGGMRQPRQDFVRALEARLLDLPAPDDARLPNVMDLLNRALDMRLLRRVAIVGVLLAAGISALLLFGRDPGPQVASAGVLADAASKLLNLHTVRYRTMTEVSHGVCYTAFNAPLNEADKAVLIARGEPPVDTGIVYGCFDGPQVHFEEGVYDLDNQAFSAMMRLVEGETGIRPVGGPGPFAPTQRTYVNGLLYTKSEGGEWRLQPTRNRWAPFTFDGFGQVPTGNLDSLTAAYDQVLKLGEDKIDGVRVAHYRASRAIRAGPETVEAWIGIEDGLPRRAVITDETENSEEMHMKSITDRPSDPETDKYRKGPIIRRGEWPSKKVITYTYSFWDFNKPVVIEAPIP